MSRGIVGLGMIAAWVSPLEKQFMRSMSFDLYWRLYRQVSGAVREEADPVFLMVHRELRSCDD